MAPLELYRDPKPDPRVSAAPQYIIFLNNPGRDAHGRILLTDRCQSLEELANEIEKIKAKLDQMLKQATARWGK
jgi:hypothetical protein